MNFIRLKKWLPFLTAGAISLLIIYFSSCKIDHGLEPIYSKISGKVFITGEAPEKTDEIRVAVIKKFPPKRINELLFSNRISYQNDTSSYEIFVPPGTYDVVAVIWKEKYGAWNISDVVGVYGGIFIGDQLLPSYVPVTVPDNDAIVDSIDIPINLNVVNRPVTIEGNVTFQGSWPQNTGTMAVGAFTDIPEKGNFIDYYFKSVYIDFSLSTFVTEDDYRLRVHLGDTLRYISVLWINDTYDFSSITDIGFYATDADPNQPDSIVTNNREYKNIDILVDFSKMQE